MQGVLLNMGVPHEVVRREDFKGFDLKDTGVLLINCNAVLRALHLPEL
jgi:hypothetical protein